MNTVPAQRRDDVLGRLSSRATVWMVGAGLLSLHASIFTLSIIGMVFWNIYDSPNDLWVDEVLLRWGVVLGFHAIAVAAGWTAWRLIRAEQVAIDTARTRWNPAVLPAATHSVPQNRWRPPIDTSANLDAPVSRLEGATKRAFVSYTAWSATIARRTITAVSSSASKLTSERRGPAIEPGDTNAEPAGSWPEHPIRVRVDEEVFVARFGTHIDVQEEGRVEPRLDHTPANGMSDPIMPFINKEAGQTWVEAATGGWIAPKAEELPAETTPSNGHHRMPGATADLDTPADGATPQR